MSVRPRRSLLNPALQRPSALTSVPRNPSLLWLDKNENLDPILGELSVGLVRDLSVTSLTTYPEAGEVYRKLARWVGVAPECLLLTPGSDGAIRLTFEAFVEHGDAVVHTSPTFAMYPVYSQMFGAEAHVVEYQRTDAGPWLDASAIIAAVRTHRPKLLCLPNPDSPTGTIVEADMVRELLHECEEAGTVLLLDEAYHPFYDWSAASWVEASKNLIVARTFAKAWGAAGFRIGYAVAHHETIGLLHKMRPMYEVSTVAVEFIVRMLEHITEMNQAVSRINDGKAFFLGQMRALGFPVIDTAGNFVHVNFGEHRSALHEALKPRVLYRPDFDHPCLKGYSRFSVAPREIMGQVSDLIAHTLLGNRL